MVAKSVIEIDVLDARFKTFVAEFEKVQKAVKAMTIEWQKIGAASTKATQTNNKELDKTVKAQKQISAEVEKADKNQKSLNKSIRDGNRELSTAARTAASIAGSLANAALSVAKWTAYGAIGGGFGFGSLASSASDYRRQAQGYGVSTGQLRAANTNFGKYISPESALGNIANIKNDLSKQWILTGMGVGANQNPAEALPSAIRNAVNIFKQGGQSQQYAQARGLTEVFSLEELRRLSSLSEQELSDTIDAYKRDQEKMEVSDSDSKAWQDFWVQLKRSGELIETALIGKLVALAPLLDKFSQNITNILLKFVDSLGQYLASDRFPQDVRKFSDALVALFEIVKKVARFMGVLPDSKNSAREFNPQQAEEARTLRESSSTPKTLQGKQQAAYKFYRQMGLNHYAALGMVANLMQESSMDENALNFNPDTKEEHRGLMQWDKGRYANYLKLYGDPRKDKDAFYHQLQFSMQEFSTTESRAYDKLKKAIDIKGGVEGGLAAERPAAPGTFAYSREVERRMHIANTITINDNTGGSVTTTTNTLPGAGSAQ